MKLKEGYELVSVQETSVAFENFRKIYKDERSVVYFWDMVGYTPFDEDLNALHATWQMPKKAVRMIHLMAGPHYRAVIKAKEIIDG